MWEARGIMPVFGVEPSLRLEGERTCDRLVMSALVLVPRRDKMMGLNDSQSTHESRGRKGTKAQSTHTAGPREGDGPFGVTSQERVQVESRATHGKALVQAWCHLMRTGK